MNLTIVTVLYKHNTWCRRLIDVITNWSIKDWSLASMACKILYNYSTGITSCHQCFGDALAEDLVTILTDLLG